MFGVEPYLVETFVNTDKYWGTCCRAAFFRYLGETRGFSKEGKTFIYHGHRKAVYAYLLDRRFPSIIEACPRRYRTPKVRERVINMQLAKPDWNPKLLDDVGLGADQAPELGGLLNDFLDPFRFNHARMRNIYKNELSSRVVDPAGMLFPVTVRSSSRKGNTRLVWIGSITDGLARPITASQGFLSAMPAIGAMAWWTMSCSCLRSGSPMTTNLCGRSAAFRARSPSRPSRKWRPRC